MRSLASLLPFVLIGLVFWLLLIRPAQSRQRRLAQMQAELLPGARVITTAGLHATVVALEDDVVVLETSPGITSRWARGAVGQVLPSSSGSGADDTTHRASDEAPGAGEGPVSFDKRDKPAPPDSATG
ncbi:preprotein translocase subunit YajC [Motilibacter deserti]|uniref:Preprotein translocase subunit YajC n=1 Tax=Motilibacter deserti TaxID=2714956 RepID=A0ABX0GWF3_9ACTN|nr:preprotein translocase subunit YajC [Motilibacter deserti]